MGQLGGRKQVALVQHDQIGLFQLLFINVEDVVGKAGRTVLLGGLSQPVQHAHLVSVEEHGKRRQIELPPMKLLQRLEHRCRQIGAASDRLADEHVRVGIADQSLHGGDHVGKPATKAAAGDLFHLGAGLFEKLGIDQVAA